MSEQSASGSSGSVSLVYIKRRHGTILLHAGHQYHTKIKHNSGLRVWQCTQRSTCKGIMRIKVLLNNLENLAEAEKDVVRCRRELQSVRVNAIVNKGLAELRYQPRALTHLNITEEIG